MNKNTTPEILPTGGVSWVMQNVVKEYNARNIEGIVVAIKLKDGAFISSHSTGEGTSYLEKLGLVSQLEEDIKSGVR